MVFIGLDFSGELITREVNRPYSNPLIRLNPVLITNILLCTSYCQFIFKGLWVSLLHTQREAFEIIAFMMGNIDRMVRSSAQYVKHLNAASAVRGGGKNNLPEQL